MTQKEFNNKIFTQKSEVQTFDIKKDRNYIILDIETSPDVRLAGTLDKIEDKKTKFLPDELPEYKEYKKQKIVKEIENIKKKYKKQETIDKYINELADKDYQSEYEKLQEKYNSKIQNLAVKPQFAMIKVVNLKFNNELITFTNENLNYKIEKEIIESVYEILYQKITGEGGTKTYELVTFNGKHFDIPVLIERGAVVNAEIGFRWLELLLKRGEHFGHYDLIENRAFENSIVNKFNLNKNLVMRFGEEFAKMPIDFATVDFKTLLTYSIDEILKMEKFYRYHCGMEHNEFYKNMKRKYLKN